MAATLTTVSDLRLRLDDIPAGTEVDAKLQTFLDSAEATVLSHLPGLTIAPPAPADLTEIIYQLASSLYLTRGTAARLETVGADGQGGFQYAGGLTQEQRRQIGQLRITLFGVPV